MKLITGEYTECTDQNMINEYNELAYQLNREIAKFSDDEVLTKHRRIIFLFSILVEYPGPNKKAAAVNQRHSLYKCRAIHSILVYAN